MKLRIEDHGIIGNLRTVALVGLDGTIDFLCAPSFDSPSVFAGLLDPERGGSFKLAPALDGAHHKQLYLPDTNVLLTRFLSAEGVAEVSDLMPLGERDFRIVRRAKAVRGDVHFRLHCAPRFNYARAGHRVEVADGDVRFVPEGPGPVLRLRASVPLRVHNGDAVAEWLLPAGETATVVLEEVRAGEASPAEAPHYEARTFKETTNFWRSWIGRSSYQGFWRDEVHRSALVLKLLASEEHGSLVAAPTFGLPETVGGVRNWDYRYTWIRDASFTLYALIRLGLTEETAAFMRWIEARCAEPNPVGSPLQALYGLDGRHELPETILDHLDGYLESRPVRIGNAAHAQLQLDLYGALLDSVYLFDKYGPGIAYNAWCNVRMLVEWVCDNWHRRDEGIWEVRGGRQHFLHSRLMCWVALDRAVRLAWKRSLPAPLTRWVGIRDRIHFSIWHEFWDDRLNAFVQFPGAGAMDASVMMMPLVRFISPTDPRWLSTLAAVRARLLDDSLVHRYRTDRAADDGLPNGEGTFSICSFWYVECLSRAGDLQQARFLFEKMLGYANHLGLYAEELGPTGEHLGNFPQAFTHLALVSAAHDLNRRLERSVGRSRPERMTPLA